MDKKPTMKQGVALLGDTEESVVAKLRELGVKGERESQCGCPIAVYIAEYTDEGFARVHSNGVVNPDVQCLDYYLPDHVVKFITNFDKGMYDDLVRSYNNARSNKAP